MGLCWRPLCVFSPCRSTPLGSDSCDCCYEEDSVFFFFSIESSHSFLLLSREWVNFLGERLAPLFLSLVSLSLLCLLRYYYDDDHHRGQLWWGICLGWPIFFFVFNADQSVVLIWLVALLCASFIPPSIRSQELFNCFSFLSFIKMGFCSCLPPRAFVCVGQSLSLFCRRKKSKKKKKKRRLKAISKKQKNKKKGNTAR